jgi:hypothetical protein
VQILLAHAGSRRRLFPFPKSEETWVRVQVDELRIVQPDVAARVNEILGDRRERYLAAVKRNDGTAPHKAHGKYLLSGGMLVCPSCGGHFEARKYPWKPSPKTAEMLPPKARVGHPGHVYICSTRRRKPGVCHNTLALPIEETDEEVLSIVEGEVLGSDYIRELLSLVESAVDETPRLLAEQARLQKERDNLVKSIAAGVPPDTIAPAIREREDQLRPWKRGCGFRASPGATRNGYEPRWNNGLTIGSENYVRSLG